MATLTNSLPLSSTANAITIPEKPAPLRINFRQLNRNVSDIQIKLADLGISPRDVVSIVMPNSYELIVSFLAITRQRGIAAPLSPAYKQNEFEFFIRDSQSSLILVPQGCFDRNDHVVKAARACHTAIAECAVDGEAVTLQIKELGALNKRKQQKIETAEPEDIALLLHTSGTTSTPKAVPLSHRNLTQTMSNVQATYQLSPLDSGFLVMPLFHVHGLVAGLLAPLSAGGSVVVPPRFSGSEFWTDFIACQANWYTAVPTIHRILLQVPQPDPMPNIRFIRSCSAHLSSNTLQEMESKFRAPVLEAYGMTEAAHQVTSNPLPPGKRIKGSVGIEQGVSIKILDDNGDEVSHEQEGEICVKGENVTQGYVNNPLANRSAFTADGYFRTGDLGKKSADGYLSITGRIKELINKGGEKISPAELDSALMNHADIAEVVTFAIPDPGHYGEDIGVAVVPKEKQQISEESIKRWMIEQVVKFKVPKKVCVKPEVVAVR